MSKSVSQRLAPIGLSYVNPRLDVQVDGAISAHAYFHDSPKADPSAQANIHQMLRGGVRLAVLSHGLNDPDLLPGALGTDYMFRCLEALASQIEADSRCVLVRNKRDLRTARRDDKLAIVLHLTGSPINGSLQLLRMYYRIGVRLIHPVIRNDPAGGDSSNEPSAGLTALGKNIVKEAIKIGMIVDTAHTNDQSFNDMLGLTRGLLIDSHTACRSIFDTPRNRTDAQMRKLADRDGVIGVHFASGLLAEVAHDPMRKKLLEQFRHKVDAMRKRYRDPYAFMAHRYDPKQWPKSLGGAIDDGHEPPRATLDQMIDHIDHLVHVAGVDHVCIGSDYVLGNICHGLETADKLPRLAMALKQRGYRQTDVNKLMYRNLYRVLLRALPDP